MKKILLFGALALLLGCETPEQIAAKQVAADRSQARIKAIYDACLSGNQGACQVLASMSAPRPMPPVMMPYPAPAQQGYGNGGTFDVGQSVGNAAMAGAMMRY